jgi:hypothetical protein
MKEIHLYLTENAIKQLNINIITKMMKRLEMNLSDEFVKEILSSIKNNENTVSIEVK